MNLLDKYWNFLLKYEGWYSNHPNDYGGETILGISKVFYPNLKIWSIPRNNVEEIKKEARKFYNEHYFYLYDKIPYKKVAIFLIDTAINMGTTTAIKLLQRVIGAVDDGIIGKETLTKLQKYKEEEVLFSFFWVRQQRYNDIVRRDKSQLVFLAGWTNRNFDLYKMLAL